MDVLVLRSGSGSGLAEILNPSCLALIPELSEKASISSLAIFVLRCWIMSDCFDKLF
jgi:hypothetical protein